MNKRIETFKSTFKLIGVDAFLVTDPANLLYLSGFTGSNGMLIVPKNHPPIFYTDFRYKEQTKQEIVGCNVKIWNRNLYSEFPVADLTGVNKLGFEKNNLSYGRFETIKKQLKSKVKLVPTEGVIETLRITKDSIELRRIRKAVSITDKVFANVLKLIKPKVTEKDLATEIDYQFTKQGGIAFPTIVAFGERGALPHAQPTDKKLRVGDSIVFDIGAKYQNYCADMTRTVVMGNASKKFRQVYEIVLTAQRIAEEKVSAGKKAVEIDGYARNYIKEKGFGDYFGHGLGHAVGIAVHEVPTLSSQSKDILQVNTTVTVEPGIYLPGEFGIRIEDLVVVESQGCEILTKSPKELIEL